MFKPSDLVTTRSCPNAEFPVLNKRIIFQANPSFQKPGGDLGDVSYFPAQDRTLEGREIRDLCNPNLVPAHAHDQCILVEAHKLKSKLLFIESSGLVVIGCWNKTHHLP